MIAKTSKPPLCRHCKVRMPDATQPIHDECVSPWWAKERARKERNAANKAKREAVADRVATRQKLDAMKTKPQLVALLQKAFNSFIRARDAGKLCISCDTPLPSEGVGGAFDCGHYRSVGSAPHMRFVEENAHGQCKHCNRHLAGNHVAYRAGLLNRIGLHAVDRLEADQTLRKYSKEGLIEMTRYYNAETRKLKP